MASELEEWPYWADRERSERFLQFLRLRAEGDFMGSYLAYMRSGVWSSMRRRWRYLYGSWCRGCGRQDGKLELHHLTYARLGWELDIDLVLLCTSCHARYHPGSAWSVRGRAVRHARRAAL